MEPMQQHLRIWLLYLLCVLSLLFGLYLTLVPVYADPPPLPDVTPRPPPTPTAKPDSTPKPRVATLILRVHPAHEILWSVVQWQAPSGKWHDVEGWRGTVVNGKTTWWVEPKDFGKGPFRWVIYIEQGDSLLTTSQWFYLPDLSQSPLIVDVSLSTSSNE